MGNFFGCCKPAPSDKRRDIVPLTRLEVIEWANLDYPTNEVSTTKYNIITFLPKNLYEQFHRIANIYFLFICILNFLPEISAFAKEVAPIPVAVVLGITAIKDAFEDFKRYQSDKIVNHSKCQVYSCITNEFVEDEWQNLRPGCMVKLNADCVIPADILLLHSSDKTGLCHIETANLDGETNLKQREVVKGFMADSFNPADFKYVINVEVPNAEIFKFNGKLILDDNVQPLPLKSENLLLRGCIVRNTELVIGVTIYTGNDTKAMMNNRNASFKRSKLERQLNKDVIWCLAILIVLCLFSATGSGLWINTMGTSGSLFLTNTDRSPALQAFLNFWTFVIIFQAMIPLPLYVTLEFVKLAQVSHIQSDIHLYDERHDKPVEVKALNIPEDLGQIQYIFSDKTGTLTENKMEFRRCSIFGIDFIHSDDSSFISVPTNGSILSGSKATSGFSTLVGPQPLHLVKELQTFSIKPKLPSSSPASESIRDFFLLMAVCNTVVLSSNKNAAEPADSSKENFRSKTQLRKKKAAATKAKANSQNKSLFSKRNATFPINNGIANPAFNENTNVKVKSSLNLPPIPGAATTTSSSSTLKTPNKSSPFIPPFLPKLENDLDRGQSPLDDDDEKWLCKDDENVNDWEQTATTSNSPPNTASAAATAAHVVAAGEECPTDLDVLLANYEAESPDEMALVKISSIYNCRLVQRGPGFVTLWTKDDGVVTFDILQILPFDATRKRMSVIFKHPLTNEIMVFSKGADATMLNILKPANSELDPNYHTALSQTKNHMTSYARLGLRTLVMAKRTMIQKEYLDWQMRYNDALNNAATEKELLKLTCEVEKDLTFLGASGIEDQLQEGVPETISSLRAAGINIWVLTGDKQETAINIAYSAQLFSENQTLFLLNSDSKTGTARFIESYLNDIKEKYNQEVEIRQRHRRPPVRKDLALCIDGETLKFALEEDLKILFLRLCEQCSSVICCRSTPKQKASIVKLVKENLRMQTLAIGDGANDVNMIREADVGVGISGQEGMQAVMASDFAISRFKFLKRLLLVHGYSNYDKLASLGLFLFYKCTVFIMVMFWYQLFNGFSGSVMVDQLYQITYNLSMTGLPALIFGIWDRPLNASTLMRNPVLYKEAQNCRSYLPWHFWYNIFDAIWQSAIWFWMGFAVFNDSDVDMWTFGNYITTVSIIGCLCHLGVETRTWTIMHWFGTLGSILVAWYLFAMIYNVACYSCLQPEGSYWVIFVTFRDVRYWLTSLVSIFCGLIPRLICKAVVNTYDPSSLEQARQLEKELGEGKVLPLIVPSNVYPVASNINASTETLNPINALSQPTTQNGGRLSSSNQKLPMNNGNNLIVHQSGSSNVVVGMNNLNRFRRRSRSVGAVESGEQKQNVKQ